MLPNIDTDNLENLTPFNNMKGSYNNLFCDNLDNEPIQILGQTESIAIPNQSITPSDQLLENVYCNVSPIKKSQTQSTPSFINGGTELTTTIGGGNGNGAHMTSNNIVDNILIESDPNLHVYSNVSSTPTTKDNRAMVIKQQQHQQQSTKILTSPSIKSNAINENSLNGNIESIINQSILRNSNSKLLSNNLNDLDLDDPTLVTSSIANQPNTSTVSKLNESFGIDKPNLSSRKMKTASGGIDDSITSTKTKLFTNDSTSANDVMIDSDIGNNNSFFDAQRIRSLHDTTMIDTALDLDSLEDTNIGLSSP